MGDKAYRAVVESITGSISIPSSPRTKSKPRPTIAELWRTAGYEVHTGVGGHGVVGVLKNGPGPTLMLRTDLDALPVTKNTGLNIASRCR